MVAQEQKFSVLKVSRDEFMGSIGKGVLIGVLKQPHDLVFDGGNIGDIVNLVTNADTVFRAPAIALAHIHQHGPAFGFELTGARGHVSREREAMAHGRLRRHGQARCGYCFQEFSSTDGHDASPSPETPVATWHSQQGGVTSLYA